MSQEKQQKSDKLNEYLKDYILLKETKEHPDLIIAKNRLTYNKKVEQVSKKLNLDLQNNLEDYIVNINWNESHNLLKELNSFMLNPKLFAEFLKLLKSGNAFDGNKDKVNSNELEKILNGIIELRNPCRAEWLDHKYFKSSNKLQVTYHKFDSSGKLIEFTEKLDPDTLLKYILSEIILEDWINNTTSQGLPKSNVQKGDLYYWRPREGRVAGFDANAGRADLDCVGDPDNSGGDLGVREVKIFKK